MILIKFAKIEIEAFRAFKEKVKLDFRKGSKVSNLIVIYGMNGYGKTSFFDAIEWAMTGRIQRINKNSTKVERDYIRSRLNRTERQYVLKNQESSNEYGEIMILFDNNKKLFKKTSKITKPYGTDYREIPINEDFKLKREQILTQDAIDAFLKAKTPLERYKLFSNYLLDSEGNLNYNQWYSVLSKMVNFSKKVVKGEEINIKKLKYEIKNAHFSKNILNKINNEINKLNNNLSKYEILAEDLTLEYISTPITEREFEDYLIDVKSKKKSISNNKSILVDKEYKNLIEITELKNLYSKYMKNSSELHLINNKINKNRNKLQNILLNRRNRLLLDKFLYIIDSTESFHEFFSKYKEFSKVKEEVKNLLNLKNNFWFFLNDKIAKFVKQLGVHDFKKYDLFWLDDPFRIFYFDTTTNINNIKSKIDDLKDEFDDYAPLEKDFSNLKKIGMDFIKKSELKFCPLCGQEPLNEFHSILKQIKETKINLKLSNENKREVEYLENSLKLGQSQLFDIKNKVEEVSSDYQSRIKLIVDINENCINGLNTINYTSYKLLSFREEIDFFQHLLKNPESKELYFDFLEGYRNNFKNSYDTTLYLNIKEINEDLKGKLYFLKMEEEVSSIEEFQELFYDIGIDIAELKNAEDIDFEGIIEEIEIKQKQIDKRDKSDILKPEDIHIQLRKATQVRDELNDFIKNYEKRMIHFLKKTPKNFDQIENLEKKKRKKIDLIENLDMKFEKIISLFSELRSIVKFDQKKVDLENKLKKIKYQKKLNRRLTRAKNLLQIYIELSINNYFNQNMINELYQKLDPHPIYKQINFNVSLKRDTPNLNIFVSNEENSKLPTLYFSSAQINIISLCIFLARALQSDHQINSIFLDDPIQNMDTINILSFIDLLRILIGEKFNKQIILSTQNESIYRLIKQKIASENYPSKFFRLISTGEVKED